MRRLTSGLLAIGLMWLAPPAFAHGIGGRLDLPVPVSYFAVGAGLVVVLSFALLALLWPQPRLQGGTPPDRGLLAPGPAATTARLGGLVALALVIGAGVVQAVSRNDGAGPTIAPVLVWVVFWLVIPFLSVLVGDLYAAVNPWRTLGAKIGAIERDDIWERLGVWPAVVVFLGFAWMELVWPDSGSAVTLGAAAIIYTGVLIGAMSLFGRETGLRLVDMFTTYNRMFGAVAPIGRLRGRAVWRGWLRGLTSLEEPPGFWAFVVVAIGTVSYDGLSATSWWPAAGMVGQTFLLMGVVCVVGLAYMGACWVAVRVTLGEFTTLGVARRFAHTLVPIGIAYAVAHYLTLILFEGQQMISALSDPFGLGWNLFGTAERRINFFIRTPEPIWYVQVALIVVGHVTGVVLAHDRALADFSGPDAVRSQYAMLALMVVLTGLGLVILAG